MTSRRNVLKGIIRGAAVAGSGGLVWGATVQASQAAPLALRPPGALPDPEFRKACIRCGQCVEACPYDSLKLAELTESKTNGMPFFEPRQTPCYLCTDYPCTSVCPSGALDLAQLTIGEEKANIVNSKMGLAVIHKESCIAYWGIRCDACYRACPLLDEAIALQYDKSEVTGKHANFKPVVNSNACTGCGICEHACVVEKAAIRVLPIDVATGKVGDHYIKSWQEGDEQRIRAIEDKENDDDADINSALDYLNDDDELFK